MPARACAARRPDVPSDRLTAKEIRAAVRTLRAHSAPFGVPCPPHGGVPMRPGESRYCGVCGAIVMVSREPIPTVDETAFPESGKELHRVIEEELCRSEDGPHRPRIGRRGSGPARNGFRFWTLYRDCPRGGLRVGSTGAFSTALSFAFARAPLTATLTAPL